MNARRTILTAALAAIATLVLASPAAAATPAPSWAIESFASPTHFSAADPPCASCEQDHYTVTATNVGSEPTSGSEAVVLEDSLPPGLEVQRVAFRWTGLERAAGLPNETNLATFGFCPTQLRCELPAEFSVFPDEQLQMQIFVTVEAAAEEGPLANEVSVAGGDAAPAAATGHNEIFAGRPPFGTSAFGNLLAGLDGSVATQAGGHPYELTTAIDLNNAFRHLPDFLASIGPTSVEDPRDIAVDLPLGFLGSALAAPECTLAELSSEARCPADTRVGHLETESPVHNTSISGPIWNLVPEPGVAAEFGYIDGLKASHVLYASVVPGAEGYVLRTTSPEIPQISLDQIRANFYGDPAARAAGRPQTSKDPAFFTNPASCDGKPLLTRIHLDSWQNPGARNPDGSLDVEGPGWASAVSESPAVTGCNQLQFHPVLEAAPETNRGDSPTGLDVTLKVPQNEGIDTLGTPPLKEAVVSLPEGMSVNPSSANGLGGCSLADLGMSPSGEPNAASPNCPDASKIGTVELKSPDLPGILEGQIYVAKQSENPFGSLLALYIVVDDSRTGVVVKIPAEIKADPVTGQLTTIVENSPQFPFSELRTHFFGGTKAALRTPSVCGTYKVTSTLTPWSAPESGPPATPSGSFKITQGCAPSAGEEPNKPSFSAGTETPVAGAFSPLGLELSREDGSQELNGLNLTLPPGLIGKLAGLSECSESQLATVAARSGLGQGAQEQSSPSCPASSEVGSVTVGAGAGLTPYYAQGHAYLAGPYKGAPLSLAVITPAVAGPFDLGDVLVRNALYVNPETAQITAKSDPIPHILFGIPLDIRSIALNMSRPNFTLNPTSCEKKAVTGEALSVLGNAASLSNPFQVGGCKALGFKPKLKISLKGSTKRAGHPALKAVVTYPKKGAYANIARAQVNLPHSEFLDQAHIGTVCTRVVFAEGQKLGEKCPAKSVYGFAKATTPLLDKPVEGPVYLRSSSHKLPDLVAALNGQISVALVGKVDTGPNKGIRNSFEVVPDAPVTKFTLTMKGGAKGLLVNSEDICAHTQRAIAHFVAQNGKVDDFNPVIANSCKKGGKGKKHGKHGGGR